MQLETTSIIAARMVEQYGPRGSQLNGPRIASVIGQLVSSGELQPGQKLPTVRALSRALHVSPSTVSDAWRVLRSHAVIETDRRRGTIVRSTIGNVDGRYWHVPVTPGTLDHDLSMGTPDPALLPPLAPALQKVQLDSTVTSYLDDPVIPELEELLRTDWPFEPERFTMVDGAQDGVDRVVNAVVNFGDAVIVEDPTFPPIIDMLELAGARLIVVASDEDGPVPDDVAKAMGERPVAAFLQPRSQNPTAVSITKQRALDLANSIDGHPMVVVEDDHSGPVAGVPLHSLGVHLPQQTVHIRSFSKSHGPDLRLAAIGGSATVLDSVIKRRHLGPSWTSRLLQRLLLELLGDPTAVSTVERAGSVYAERRANFVDRLEARGFEIGGDSGMNVWIPVSNEQRAVVGLAAHGIGVAPGRPFMVAPSAGEYVRATVASLTAEVDLIADTLASVA